MKPNFFITLISKIFVFIFVISYLITPKTVSQLAFVLAGSKENESEEDFLSDPKDNNQAEDRHQHFKEHKNISFISNSGLDSRFHNPVVLKRRG